MVGRECDGRRVAEDAEGNEPGSGCRVGHGQMTDKQHPSSHPPRPRALHLKAIPSSPSDPPPYTFLLPSSPPLPYQTTNSMTNQPSNQLTLPHPPPSLTHTTRRSRGSGSSGGGGEEGGGGPQARVRGGT